MGNCLIHQEIKGVKIMKMDGKILEYHHQTPLKVHQVLSEFSAGHTISDALLVHQHLGLDTELLRGRLYYLLPPPFMPSIDDCHEKRTLNESVDDPELHETTTNTTTGSSSSTALRIKLVITKQELKEMLIKGGISTTVDEMISQIQNQEISKDFLVDDGSCRGWRPKLDSIPE